MSPPPHFLRSPASHRHGITSDVNIPLPGTVLESLAPTQIIGSASSIRPRAPKSSTQAKAKIVDRRVRIADLAVFRRRLALRPGQQ